MFILAMDKRQVGLLHEELGRHDAVVLGELSFQLLCHTYDLLAAGESFGIPSNL